MAPSLLGKGRLALPPGRLGEVHPADEGRHSVCDEAVHRLPAHRDQVRGMRHDVVDRPAVGQVFAQKPVHRARRLPGQVGSAVRLPKRPPVVLMGARGEVHPLLQGALGVVDAPVADIGGLLEPPAFPLAEVRADGVAFPAVAVWLSAEVLVVADVAVAAGDSPQRAAVRHDAGRAASVVWEFRRSSRLMVEGARCSLRAISLMVALSFPCACPLAQANSSTSCRLSFSLRCGMISPCVSMTGDAASRNQAAPPPWTWFLKENASRQLGQIKRFSHFSGQMKLAIPKRVRLIFLGWQGNPRGGRRSVPVFPRKDILGVSSLFGHPPARGSSPRPPDGSVLFFIRFNPSFFPS